MKKNSCTPINPKKYSCNGLNKIHAKNLITKKNSCSSKIPLSPHNFANGLSLRYLSEPWCFLLCSTVHVLFLFSYFCRGLCHGRDTHHLLQQYQDIHPVSSVWSIEQLHMSEWTGSVVMQYVGRRELAGASGLSREIILCCFWLVWRVRLAVYQQLFQHLLWL